jgi:hypothetical protein
MTLVVKPALFDNGRIQTTLTTYFLIIFVYQINIFASLSSISTPLRKILGPLQQSVGVGGKPRDGKRH